jgi:hypothetical protein
MEKFDVDASGFNQMIRKLKKYNGAAARPVVRAVTSDILASAARKTKKTNAKAVKESIDKKFREPFEVAGKGFLAVTQSGKVWVNLNSWGDKKKWALLHTDGKLKNVPRDVRRTGSYKAGSRVNFGSKYKTEMNAMIQVAKRFKTTETKYRKSLIGLSKASWYYLMKTLRLKLPSNAPKYAVNMNIPTKAKAALKAFERLRGKDNFSIIISNAVQACLNPKAKGIGAFRMALNGQVKGFKTAMQKDQKKYIEQFATRHGFIVK